MPKELTPHFGQHVIYAFTEKESLEYGRDLAPAKVIWVHDDEKGQPKSLLVNLEVSIPYHEPIYLRKVPKGSVPGSWR